MKKISSSKQDTKSNRDNYGAMFCALRNRMSLSLSRCIMYKTYGFYRRYWIWGLCDIAKTGMAQERLTTRRISSTIAFISLLSRYWGLYLSSVENQSKSYYCQIADCRIRYWRLHRHSYFGYVARSSDPITSICYYPNIAGSCPVLPSRLNEDVYYNTVTCRTSMELLFRCLSAHNGDCLKPWN